MKTLRIAPSLLSADFADLSSGIALAETSGADWLHMDVMDGRFVPSITFGDKLVADAKKRTRLPLDVHLMTLEPERLADAFIEAGADWLTFHAEACVHAHRLAQRIREKGVHPGISIVPSTSLVALEELLPFVDLVLVMTVNPGAGGQKLIPSCLDKVARLSALRKERNLSFLISVDGGVNRATMSSLAAVSPEVLVMGSAFYGAIDPASEIAYARAAFS